MNGGLFYILFSERYIYVVYLKKKSTKKLYDFFSSIALCKIISDLAFNIFWKLNIYLVFPFISKSLIFLLSSVICRKDAFTAQRI